MSKYLVGTIDGVVRSFHESPLDFSLSGKYVVDAPLSVDVTTSSLTDLVDAKITAFMAAHPTLAYENHDELISSPNIDASKSSGYMNGPNKRTVILPGGHVTTNPIVVANPVTSGFFHWHGFTLYSHPGSVSDSPPPPRLLYNYDPDTSDFFDFDPATFGVLLRDSADTVTYLNAVSDVEQGVTLAAGSYILRFTNTSTKLYHLSDWVMLLDG